MGQTILFGKNIIIFDLFLFRDDVFFICFVSKQFILLINIRLLVLSQCVMYRSSPNSQKHNELYRGTYFI